MQTIASVKSSLTADFEFMSWCVVIVLESRLSSLEIDDRSGGRRDFETRGASCRTFARALKTYLPSRQLPGLGLEHLLWDTGRSMLDNEYQLW